METNNSSRRVAQHLRALAEAGPAGARLPSVRELMRTLQVSPVTVQRALDQLGRAGLLETRPGQGTFVAASASTPTPADLGWQSAALGPARVSADALRTLTELPPPGARALNAGYLPQGLQPAALLAAATARAARRPDVWARMPPEGLADLRAWFAAGSDAAFAAHEVTITPGSQAAISAAFRGLALPGDPVLMESPTYVGALVAAQSAGLRIVPVPTDADGVRPDLLAEALRRTGARLIYLQPTFANPTGAVLPPARRVAVLDAAAVAGAFIVEDDWARDFALDGPPPPSLASGARDGHVVLVRSITKCASPGLRIGALCARGAALERLRTARLADDFFVPGLLQETALQLLTAPGWTRHIQAVRRTLRAHRDAAAAALRRHLGPDCLPDPPEGGLHLWLRLPDGVADTEIERAAAIQGLLVCAGRAWFPAEPPAPYLRLSFAAAAPEWIDDCAATLAALIADART